jgi:hypothetical protein
LVAGTPAPQPVRLFGVWNVRCRVVGGRARCWVLRDRLRACSVLVPRTSVNRGSGDLECRPYVENYTVDASIFDSTRKCRNDINDLIYFRPLVMSDAGLPVSDTIHTHVCGQVSKSKRWMPWQLEPKKDVAICDNPRGADKRASIRGSPNGETPVGVAIRPADSRLNI